MSAFISTAKNEEAKVHHSQYIRTANTPDETGTKPVEPAKPATEPAAK